MIDLNCVVDYKADWVHIF